MKDGGLAWGMTAEKQRKWLGLGRREGAKQPARPWWEVVVEAGMGGAAAGLEPVPGKKEKEGDRRPKAKASPSKGSSSCKALSTRKGRRSGDSSGKCKKAGQGSGSGRGLQRLRQLLGHLCGYSGAGCLAVQGQEQLQLPLRGEALV